MRKIQVFGMGCPKCNQLEANAKEAVKRLGIDAEVEKITDLDKISGAGVMLTPALAVDGQVKAVKMSGESIAEDTVCKSP